MKQDTKQGLNASKILEQEIDMLKDIIKKNDHVDPAHKRKPQFQKDRPNHELKE